LLAARQLISHYDHSRADQITFAFEFQLATGRVGKFRLDMTISLFCVEDPSCSRGSLQPGRDIDRISQHGIVRNRTFSNIANKGLPCSDTRADVQMGSARAKLFIPRTAASIVTAIPFGLLGAEICRALAKAELAYPI
jgi:hypothetical protein